ncbi:MAG TPA: hypothetical protein VF861_12140 [Telluria sp.]
MKMVIAAASLTVGFLLSFPQLAAAQSVPDSRQQIEGIIETFRTAIINKDTASFMGLFQREDITWAGVYTDGSVERWNASLKDPTVPRATKYHPGTPRRFIESIARSRDIREETFSNVRIDTDGEVAHVWFDYTMMVGNHRNNWGKESWQLVRSEAGWKIAAVVWSAEENPVPRPKQ